MMNEVMKKKKTSAPLPGAKLYTLYLHVWMSAFYTIKHVDDDCYYGIYLFVTHIKKIPGQKCIHFTFL